MHKRALGTVIRTNSHGMREREIPIEKPASVVRIAALGDSYTFGFGVPGRRAYPRVLESLLNDGAQGEARFEVLNFGVGGYSTRDEAIVLRHRALAWKPDLVILGYALNDPEDEPFQPLHAYFRPTQWWQHFELLRLFAQARWKWRVRRYGDGDYLRSLHGDPRWWGNVVNAFESIRGATRSAGSRVLVVIFPMNTVVEWAQYPYADVHEQVARTAVAHGFDALDLLPVFAGRLPGEVRLTDSDAHPNEEGHRLAAEAIAARLRGNEERFFGAGAATSRSPRPSGPSAP
jgi:lysophospholipase L1-like esterase